MLNITDTLRKLSKILKSHNFPKIAYYYKTNKMQNRGKNSQLGMKFFIMSFIGPKILQKKFGPNMLVKTLGNDKKNILRRSQRDFLKIK